MGSGPDDGRLDTRRAGRRHRRPRAACRRVRRERGAALVLGSLVLALLAAIAVALLFAAKGRADGSRDVCDSISASLYAEAAAVIYLDRVNTGAIPRADLEAGRAPEATFRGPSRSATVRCDASAFPLGLRVDSAASVGTRVVRLEVRGAPSRSGSGGLPVGLGALGDLHLRTGVRVDAYDSGAGPYAASGGAPARIGAGGGVRIDLGAEVVGDIVFGTVSGLLSGLTGGLLGEPAPDLPLVDAEVDAAIAEAAVRNDNARLVAAVAATGGAWELDRGELRSRSANPPPLRVPAGVYALTGIDAQRGALVELGAGRTVLAVSGNALFRRDGALALASGAEGVLYVRGRARLRGALPGGVDPDQALLRPGALRVLGHSAGGNLVVEDSAVLFAAIEWPGGAVVVERDAEVFGAVIGASVEVERGGALHLDLSLGGAAYTRPFVPASYRKEPLH